MSTRPDLPAHLPSSLRTPIVTAVLGVLVWLAGFAVGHVPYGPSAPGTAHYDAHVWAHLCAVGAVQTWPPPGSLATTSSACIHAPEVVHLSGLLVLVGLAAIVAGAVIAVRRHRAEDARQASMARHPAQGSRELA